MEKERIEVGYLHGMERLEKLMSVVRRPGDFFMQGRVEVPMPKLEVEGVGVISFPVPAIQARQLMEQAELAPYGRGEETILDTSIRRVWQLAPDRVTLGGRSWERVFQGMMDQVAVGLGREPNSVSAELYKMLVYDPGAFFASHRDTEKASGMFGTLVVSLPSAHCGGELVIRHHGHEATVDLSSEEVSELVFTAFYADCLHEVKPMIEGHRVCLIYNLVHRHTAGDAPFVAPRYDAEAEEAAKLLNEAFGGPTPPAKIVWLLEHQYSPDGLSFRTLKNTDAARAKVLAQAAAQCCCAAHLGIVHIEETGSAESDYNGGYGYGRRSRWRRPDEAGTNVRNDDFEVIDVYGRQKYIAEWVDSEDHSVEFGGIPLGESELLPNGALDNEVPDEQRVTEATGNEGASFERSYHRAALVLWPQNRFADVLLQSGVGAVMPYLKKKIARAALSSDEDPERDETLALAGRVIDAWESSAYHRPPVTVAAKPSRTVMLDTLGELGDPEMLERFIAEVLTENYDGTENTALAAWSRLMKPAVVGRLLSDLVGARMQCFHGPCVDLLTRFLQIHKGNPPRDWTKALHKMAAAMVAGLREMAHVSKEERNSGYPQRTENTPPIAPETIVDLFDALVALKLGALRNTAAKNIIAFPTICDPGTVMVPAITLLHQRHGLDSKGDREFQLLWCHAAAFLLERGEYPPPSPTDWKQEAKIDCKCEDCRALEVFARDPDARVARFSVRVDRRNHLQRQIDKHGLDMTSGTERKGSPQTLVCAKTRRTYEGLCTQFMTDIRSFVELQKAQPDLAGDDRWLASRLTESQARSKEWRAHRSH